MRGHSADFFRLLESMASAEADFIVVGGVCAVLHGAPVSTFDLDVVYSRDRQNLGRLEKALKRLEARYREKPTVSPTARLLDSPGHHLLMTCFGPLDLLGSTVGDRDFNRLKPNTEIIELESKFQIRILDLPTLVKIKEELGRDKDAYVLPILKHILKQHEEKQ